MEDIGRHLLWRYLPIEDILHYCATSTDWISICEDPSTWDYLLYRDYTIRSTSSNPREEYMVEYTKEKLMKRYGKLISKLDMKFKTHVLPPDKAINISTVASINSASSCYDIYTFNILPIGSTYRINTRIAFKCHLTNQDRREYLSILYLIFDAK